MSKKTKSASVSPASPASDKKAALNRREQQKKRRQQQQTILFGIVAVAALIVVIVVVLTQNSPVEASVPDDVVNNAVINRILEKGYSGRTEQGYYFLGRADAPTLMEEFSSFSCSACLSYHDSAFKSLLDKIEAGHLKFVYIPLSTYGSFNSEGMGRGAVCAGEQGKFWQMHELMFDWQRRYASGSNDYRRLSSAAGQLGLDQAKFDACLGSSATSDLLNKAAAEATNRSINATPSVFLDGTKIYPERLDGSQGPNLSEIRGYIESKAGAN